MLGLIKCITKHCCMPTRLFSLRAAQRSSVDASWAFCRPVSAEPLRLCRFEQGRVCLCIMSASLSCASGRVSDACPERTQLAVGLSSCVLPGHTLPSTGSLSCFLAHLSHVNRLHSSGPKCNAIVQVCSLYRHSAGCWHPTGAVMPEASYLACPAIPTRVTLYVPCLKPSPGR